MKKEYDFSTAERGKFYRKSTLLRLPIYLDANLQSQLQRLAEKKHMQLGVFVRRLLKKEIHLTAK